MVTGGEFQVNNSPEEQLHNGKIDFFLCNQIFNGVVDMKEEHKHSYYEIFYVAEGERILWQDGIPYKINKENLVIIPPGYMHKTTSVTRNKQILYFFGFSDSFFDGYVNGMSTAELFNSTQVITKLKGTDKYPIIQKYDILEELAENHNTEFEKSRLKSMIFDLIFNYTEYGKRVDNSIYIGANKLNPQIKYMQIANYIRKHLDERITLDTLAEVFHMSKYEISRNFSKYLGATFIEYLNLIRIEEAQGLISNTDSSFLDIAESTGFESLSHFGKTFKKVTSMTPSYFKKTHKRNAEQTV